MMSMNHGDIFDNEKVRKTPQSKLRDKIIEESINEVELYQWLISASFTMNKCRHLLSRNSDKRREDAINKL